MKLHLFDIEITSATYRVMRCPDAMRQHAMIDHTDRVIWIAPATTEVDLIGVVAQASRQVWTYLLNVAIHAKDDQFDPHGEGLALSLYGPAGICWHGQMKRWTCPKCGKNFKTYAWFAKHVEDNHQLDRKTLWVIQEPKEAA